MPKVIKKTIKLKKTGPTADIFDFAGKMIGSLNLPKEIFGLKVNDKILAQAVRVYLANQRQGTASTKTRGEVAGSTRKIYRQKGTGRARHGSIKAPIFVGGGKIFGPHPRDFSLKMPSKMKKLALKNALSSQYQNKNMIIVDTLDKLKPKTSQIVNFFNNLKLKIKNGHLEEKILLVSLPNENLLKACRNLANLTLTSSNLLNTFTILANKKLIFTKEAVESLSHGNK